MAEVFQRHRANPQQVHQGKHAQRIDALAWIIFLEAEVMDPMGYSNIGVLAYGRQ